MKKLPPFCDVWTVLGPNSAEDSESAVFLSPRENFQAGVFWYSFSNVMFQSPDACAE